MSDIVRVHEVGTDLRYSALNIDTAELLDAIACHIPCTACGGGLVLQVPVDTPLQWEVLVSHTDGCSVPERHTTPQRLHLV